MPLRIPCPHCQTRLLIAEEYVGKVGRCATCNTPFLVHPNLSNSCARPLLSTEQTHSGTVADRGQLVAPQRPSMPLSASSTPTPPPPDAQQDSGVRDGFFGFGIVVAAGVLWACWQSISAERQQPIAQKAAPPPNAKAPRPNAKASRKLENRTLIYWKQVGGIINNPRLPAGHDPARASRQLRFAANKIEACSTLGVDEDVVGWALDLAIVLRECADFIERSNSPALLIEAIVRGSRGDPFGTVIETNEEARQVRARLEQVQQNGVRMRAILTARYGIQFP